MLQDIRQWAHGWIAWVVISLIAVVFVIWGIGANFGELFGTGSNGDVALTVGNQTFTQAQLDANYQTMITEYKSSLAAQHLPFQPEDEAKIKQISTQQLVVEAALNQFMPETGFFVSKQQADMFISRIPQLQEDGHFSMDLYQGLLSQRRQSPSDFLDEIRRRMVFMQASAAVGGSALLLPYDIDNALALIYQTRDIGYAVIDTKNFEKDVKITEVDLEAYYNGHQSEFTVPAQATIEYITLSRKAIDEEVRKLPVPEDALNALYESHNEEYTIPESRHVAHILVVVPVNATEDERKAKKKEANDLLERLRAGASFATLAKEHSEDPGSASQGGDLGVVTKGTFEPAFDDAAFEAGKDQVVGPVETPFGYHLILVTEIQPAQKEPLAQVRQALSEEWYEAESAKRFDNEVKNLSDMAFQAGTDFADLAKQFNLTIQQATLSQDVTKNTGILAMPTVMEAAFDKAAFDQKLNSELLPINADEAIVLRTTSYIESHVQPFDAVKADLEKASFARQTMRLAEDKAQAIEAALKAGTSVDAVMKEYGIVWKQEANLDRRNRTLPMEVVAAAFKTPMGDKPEYVTVPMMTGVAILAVHAIHPGKGPDFANAEEAKAFDDNLKSQLAEFMARRDFDLFTEFAKRTVMQ